MTPMRWSNASTLITGASNRPTQIGGSGARNRCTRTGLACSRASPTLEARVLRQSTEGDVVWNEWLWSATGLQMAGVTVVGIREGQISWARLYMEPVEQAGQDIDEAMRTITGQDRGDEHQEDEG